MVWLELVAFAAHNVEGHRVSEREEEAAQIPPLRVLGLVLMTEPGGPAQEAHPVAPTDRFGDFVQLLRTDLVLLREQRSKHLVQHEPRALCDPRKGRPERRPEEWSCHERMAMRVGEQATVDEQNAHDPVIEVGAFVESLLLAAERRLASKLIFQTLPGLAVT